MDYDTVGMAIPMGSYHMPCYWCSCFLLYGKQNYHIICAYAEGILL